MRIAWREMVPRITGFSTPIGGIQWKPTESESLLCRELLVFLEDRRVLFAAHEAEVPLHCVKSIEEIRSRTTDLLARSGADSPLSVSLRAIRSACRSFMEKVNADPNYLSHGLQDGHYASWVFLPALGELRILVGIQIAKLSAAYKLDIDEQLSAILPPSDSSA